MTDTARAAHRAMQGEANASVDARILAYLTAHGGATDDALEQALGLKHQTVSGNRRHLVERGLVRDSGRRATLPSGRQAIVWVVVERDAPVQPDFFGVDRVRHGWQDPGDV